MLIRLAVLVSCRVMYVETIRKSRNTSTFTAKVLLWHVTDAGISFNLQRAQNFT